MKTKYGKSTLTLEIASAETYLQIANFRFDNERVEDLISAIERFEFPESSKKFVSFICFLYRLPRQGLFLLA